MGLTASRKRAKNLAVRRKNWKILTVSRKNMLTVNNWSVNINKPNLFTSSSQNGPKT